MKINSLFYLLMFSLSIINSLYADPILLYGPYQGTATQTELSSISCLAKSLLPANKSDLQLGFIPVSSANSGLARVINGQDGAGTVFSRIFTPVNNYGYASAAAGDINLDSITDFVVSDTTAPQAFIYLSSVGGFTEVPISSTPVALTFPSRFGESLAGAYTSLGGINSTKDIIVGDSNYQVTLGTFTEPDGLIAVFDGGTGNFLYKCTGITDSSEEFGTAISSISDLNNDGVMDILVGAPKASINVGRIVVISGASGINCTPLYQLLGASLGAGIANFGGSIANVGDQNGDNVEDFLVGASNTTLGFTNQGSAHLISGANGSQLCAITGSAASQFLGHAVAATGDINYDGRSDFLISAPNTSPTGNGQVFGYTYIAASNNCVRIFTINNPGSAGVSFGDALASSSGGELCDMNGDSYPEFIVSASIINRFSSVPNAVVYSIPTPTPTVTVTPTATPSATPTLTIPPEPTTRPTPRATPKATRTATTTPTVEPLPNKSRLFFTISQSGNLAGTITLDKDPAGRCKSSLFGKFTEFDLSKAGATTTVFKDKVANRKSLRFGVSGLSRPKLPTCGKPYILHLIAKHNCAGKRIVSNVHSRFLACGSLPEVEIETFMSQLVK